MKKCLFLGVSGLALLVFASQIMAQEGRGGRGRGFGGGMFGASRINILRSEEGQEELELSDEQVEELTDILAELRPQRQGRGGEGGGEGGEGRRGGGRNIDPEQLQEIEAKALKVLEADQRKRLNGMFLWVAGARALLDDEIAKELKIDADQKAEIQEAIDASQEDMQDKFAEMRESGNFDREAMTEAINEMRESLEKEVAGLLSDDQQEMLEEMKGEKFEMPAFGGRRGRGGGG